MEAPPKALCEAVAAERPVSPGLLGSWPAATIPVADTQPTRPRLWAPLLED